MHTATTLKHWMHHVHDGSVKATHFTGHLLHERSFWGILAILMLIAGLFALVVIFGTESMPEEYVPIMPYGFYP